MTYTKKQHIEELNELGVPFQDQRSNGGRIPDNADYGTWMHRNDPIAFRISYREAQRETEGHDDARARYLYNASHGERTL